MSLQDILFAGAMTFSPNGRTELDVVSELYSYVSGNKGGGYEQTMIGDVPMTDGVSARVTRYANGTSAFCIMSLTEEGGTEHYCIPARDSDPAVLDASKALFNSTSSLYRKALMALFAKSILHVIDPKG